MYVKIVVEDLGDKYMFNIQKEMEKLEKYLKDRPDNKLINGYKRAMKDYEETNDERCKLSADIIKKEIDRRGLKIE